MTNRTITTVSLTIRGITKELEILQQEETNVWYKTTNSKAGVFKKHGANKEWLYRITFVR